MGRRALLMLEDGTAFSGYSFGADSTACGEVVFNTSMTGYQEVLTDPSYGGQMVVLTYPLIGNYGINASDIESRRIQVSAFVVRDACMTPSHRDSTQTLDGYLREAGIPGIYGVDTRALTRRLRTRGVMMGALGVEATPDELLALIQRSPRYDKLDYVAQVSTPLPYPWEEGTWFLEGLGDGVPGLGSSPNPTPSTLHPHVVVLDCGLKYNILRILRSFGCRVTAVPCTTTASDILAMEPDGILLSPGPGDPARLGNIVGTVKDLVGVKPIMGICLGHQLLGMAFGARTFKLKFGHRGANHPVLEKQTGQVHITAQNHGYAVDAATLKGGAQVSHLNLNDNTVEGLVHPDLPIVSIQYHSEASPGPLDNVYLFERFLAMVRNGDV
ncbi:MAG: glutamine-hydrolyzing carbamoyl-phosphate synthase small subunit [Dehalococcoidia bacterium]|nr:glutamine-hydrolyzing carbamoyl-phosphate synthase small subunit [Dehalococcoidia bacterium]